MEEKKKVFREKRVQIALQSITRTARLFYVACTRAKKSLAIVAYTENEEMVRDTALANGWFLENEIYIV